MAIEMHLIQPIVLVFLMLPTSFSKLARVNSNELRSAVVAANLTWSLKCKSICFRLNGPETIQRNYLSTFNKMKNMEHFLKYQELKK